MSEITDYCKWAEEKMLELFHGNPEAMHGCSPREIEVLMIAQSVSRLPQTFYEILRIGGEKAFVSLFMLTNSFEWLHTLKDRATEFFAEDGLTLPADAFVFYDHQGEQIMYFLTDNDLEDPPVYHYVEDGGVTKDMDRFSDLVEYAVKKCLRGYRGH